MAVLQARPTTYSGVEMRSRLEATFAAFLDRVRIPWQYEPRAFASPAGQYLPDFLLWPEWSEQGRVYAEVKGDLGEGEWRPTVDRMEIVLASEPRANLALLVSSEMGFRFGFRLSGRDPWLNAKFGVCGRCRSVDISFRYPSGPMVLCRACRAFTPPLAFLDPFDRPEAR